MPLWLQNFLLAIGKSLIQAVVSDVAFQVQQAREAKETEERNGVRNGRNAQAYSEAINRADQVRAALDLINRNN